MIRKNVAGQHIYFTMVAAATGAADASATVTAYRSIDGGTQASATGSVTNLGNGQYSLALSQADTNGNQIGFLFTASADVPVSITVTTTAADLTDSVRLGLSALPAGPTMVKKNQAIAAFPFPMFDSTGTPKSGLTITAQRSLDGASFAACANSATEIGNGWYTIALTAADTNGNCIAFRFSAPGAQDTDFTLVTQV